MVLCEVAAMVCSPMVALGRNWRSPVPPATTTDGPKALVRAARCDAEWRGDKILIHRQRRPLAAAPSAPVHAFPVKHLPVRMRTPHRIRSTGGQGACYCP
jgi:hypothetical protein